MVQPPLARLAEAEDRPLLLNTTERLLSGAKASIAAWSITNPQVRGVGVAALGKEGAAAHAEGAGHRPRRHQVPRPRRHHTPTHPGRIFRRRAAIHRAACFNDRTLPSHAARRQLSRAGGRGCGQGAAHTRARATRARVRRCSAPHTQVLQPSAARPRGVRPRLGGAHGSPRSTYTTTHRAAPARAVGRPRAAAQRRWRVCAEPLRAQRAAAPLPACPALPPLLRAGPTRPIGRRAPRGSLRAAGPPSAHRLRPRPAVRPPPPPTPLPPASDHCQRDLRRAGGSVQV